MRCSFYNFARVLITVYMKLFYRIQYVGKGNININGPIVLAGNHKNNLDCFAIIAGTKRTIHFLAKIELMKKFGFFMRKMQVIPVDRSKKNHDALEKAIDTLKNDEVVGIFPEGTFNKSEYVILPFKYGAVKMALEADAKIVPFAIIGEYKFLRKKIKIVFGKPYKVQEKNDLKKENVKLMNKVIRLLRSDNDE